MLTSLQASSLEQTHALVTFGYLSMLICTLCLNGNIRNNVRASMKSRSLHSLIVTVEEFLNHFRTVEQVMVEEETSNNFTERFGGLVKELREAEGMA
jgi:superfamily II helicase